MIRPSRDEWAMMMALLTAERTTCCRRAVGCVLLNGRGHVLSTGYNGVASGHAHCNEITGRTDSGSAVHGNSCFSGPAPKSGESLDSCQAIHAEQNALLQCRDVYDIHTAYVTASPCVTCCKLLLNTGCQRIVYAEEYPHTAARDIWVASGRSWEQISL